MTYMRTFFGTKIIALVFLLVLLANCSAAEESQITAPTNTYDRQAAIAADFRPVTDNYAVSPQINIADLSKIAAAGFTRVINHRPDGEGTYQPATADLQAEAKRLGLKFVDLPFKPGQLTDEVFNALDAELSASNEPTLAYCRSGTRAITIWAMSQVKAGKFTPKQVIDIAAKSGYRLQGQRSALEKLVQENR
ncbi:MAG: TIGR01244 family phosphatase [Robiginitomaculum sp.]|nr:TIGR01244 family phosphatase [Robiginitomaculum sp.]